MNHSTWNLGDVVVMKKQHPCGSNKWIIIRIGADIRIKCQGCGHSVLMPRKDFERKIKSNETIVNKPKQVEKDTSPTFTNSQSNESGTIFKWPSIEAKESVGNNDASSIFKSESDLHVLGYRLSDLNREQRWKVLSTIAIPKLGIEKVVNIIASHIRNRKRQKNGSAKFKNAIHEWEYDLESIKRVYYKNQMEWPKY